MTEKRYFKREWEEEYYIFDSQKISEKEFDEKVEYEDYRAFADCLMGDEVVDRLNKYNKEYPDCHNDVLRLEKENEQLKQQVNCHKSRIQLLSPLLDLADAIIDLSDDEKAKAFWEKRNNEVEQEWNKILKGDMNDKRAM